MSKGVRELQDLINLIDKTPQWRVEELKTVWHVFGPEVEGHYTIKKVVHAQTSHLRNIVRDLKRLGWTEATAQAAIKDEGRQKTKTQQAQAERKTAKLAARLAVDEEQTSLPLYEADIVGDASHLPPGPIGGTKKYSVDDVLIGPALAEKMLALNIEHNRPANVEREAEIADDLRHGRWVTNGDRIRFALMPINGELVQRLIDGQTRLSAIIKAGVGAPVDIVYNLPAEAFPTIDIQRPRSPGNVLHTYGVTYAASVSALIRLVWLHDTRPDERWNRRTSTPHLLELYRGDEQGWQSATQFVLSLYQKTAKVDQKTFALRSLMGAYYVCRRLYPKNPRLNEFFETLILRVGIPRDAGDPRYRLHRLLSNEATLNVIKDPKRHYSLIVLAYNAFMTNDRKVDLTWSHHESVPVPVLGG